MLYCEINRYILIEEEFQRNFVCIAYFQINEYSFHWSFNVLRHILEIKVIDFCHFIGKQYWSFRKFLCWLYGSRMTRRSTKIIEAFLNLSLIKVSFIDNLQGHIYVYCCTVDIFYLFHYLITASLTNMSNRKNSNFLQVWS